MDGTATAGKWCTDASTHSVTTGLATREGASFA